MILRRQSLCRGCRKFWFIPELKPKEFKISRSKHIKQNVCPECDSHVDFVGLSNERGDHQMFGPRIAALQYVARKVLVGEEPIAFKKELEYLKSEID